MFLNLFLFYQVVRLLGRKSVNKYLYYLYLWLAATKPPRSWGVEFVTYMFSGSLMRFVQNRWNYKKVAISGALPLETAVTPVFLDFKYEAHYVPVYINNFATSTDP